MLSVDRASDCRLAANRWDFVMPGFFDHWLEAVRFACEAQSVISMRLARLAEGGPHATAEAYEMIADKLAALTESQMAAVESIAHGEGLLVAAERAFAPVRRHVHANSCRLSRVSD
jgi:hypothetical protein